LDEIFGVANDPLLAVFEIELITNARLGKSSFEPSYFTSTKH
jgi:hypothetical protein